jgi:hypothetical protein
VYPPSWHKVRLRPFASDIIGPRLSAAHSTFDRNMADERGWRDAALWALLQRNCQLAVADSNTSSSDRPVDVPVQPAQLARERLQARGLLVAMHALSPRATDGALALFDDALQSATRADLFDDEGRPLANPRLLGGVVHCVFARDDGRCLLRVRSSAAVVGGSSSRADRAADHMVLISGICLPSVPEASFTFSRGDEPGTYAREVHFLDEEEIPYFSCDCRSFQFTIGNEVHCKHIIAAGLAVASNLATFTTVSDQHFIEMLKHG